MRILIVPGGSTNVDSRRSLDVRVVRSQKQAHKREVSADTDEHAEMSEDSPKVALIHDWPGESVLLTLIRETWFWVAMYSL